MTDFTVEDIDPKQAPDALITALAELRLAQEDEAARNNPPRPLIDFARDVRLGWGSQWQTEFTLLRRGGTPVAYGNWQRDTLIARAISG
jgi:hypothetical protein